MNEGHRDGSTSSGPPLRLRSAVSLNEADELKLAATIVEVARDLSRSIPAPRGAPYFYLDSEAPYDPHVLDALCERGIFRKYEFALDIGSGFGGRARWLATRSGCRVLGIDPRLATVAAARMLNRRARMDAQVTFQVGRPDCLPAHDRLFTHVWLVDMPYDATAATTYSEAFRVLRPGGNFALQCPISPQSRPADLLGALKDMGFVDVDAYEGIFPQLPPPCSTARERLQIALRQRLHAAALWERLEKREHGHVRLLIFARRPG